MPDPKWYVIGAAIIVFAIMLNYDLMFGIAAGVVLGVLGAIWLYLKIRLAPGRGEPDSERGAMVERFRRLTSNRREARLKELSSDRERNSR